MSREIKFRGIEKHTDEWQYGYYLADKLDHYICDFEGVESIVMAESVGQYTGLKDKNGVEIYEGDIVSVMDYDYEIQSGYADDDPRWHDPTPLKEIRKDYVTLENFRMWLKNESFGYEGEDLIDPDSCIIIGNIHQNPELL